MIEAVVLKPVALEPDAINDIDDNFKHIVIVTLTSIDTMSMSATSGACRTWGLLSLVLESLYCKPCSISVAWHR